MNIENRIKKADSLQPNVREEFLLAYLELINLRDVNEDLEMKLWKTFCDVCVYINKNKIISSSNLQKFIEEFELDCKNKEKFNIEIFLELLIYCFN